MLSALDMLTSLATSFQPSWQQCRSPQPVLPVPTLAPSELPNTLPENAKVAPALAFVVVEKKALSSKMQSQNLLYRQDPLPSKLVAWRWI